MWKEMDFFSNLVTGDETWVYLYDPESKRQSMEWCRLGSPRPQKFKTRARRSLLQFLDNLGVILIDFLEEGCTINSDRYISILRKLKEAIRRKRPELNVHDIKLHHDNARPHTFAQSLRLPAWAGLWSLILHTAPDLAPSDFHLFSSMKDSLHGERFDDRDEVKNAIKMWLKQRDAEFFRNGFLSWLKRCVNASIVAVTIL